MSAKILFNITEIVISAWAKNGSLGFAFGSALCIGAKPNVPNAGRLKVVFKKFAVGEK